MRKILLACAVSALALALLAPWARSVPGVPVPGPSVTPEAALGGGQIAISDFFSPLPDGKNGFSAFFLGVVRGADAGSGYAGYGASMFLAGETCRVTPVKAKKNKDGKKTKKGKDEKGRRYTLDCEHFEHEGEIPMTDFEMDPLLRTAHLKTQIDGSEIDVTWTGEGDLPEGGAGFGFYGEGAVDAGGIAGRWASAEGTIFGAPVGTADEGSCFSFSLMLEGAGGFAYVGDLAESFEAPRRASEVSSEGVRSRECSSRTRTARA
ncbi:MAG: hypothetical protein ACRDH9_03825 [Actinomycetota bacterium]